MRIDKKSYPITTIHGLKDKINPEPDYQRPPVWTKKQKQLLIDTILRGYDIPKFYLEELKNDETFKYAVADGQQRLRAIWEFRSNDFIIAKDADPIDGNLIAEKNYNDLDIDMRNQFDTYKLDIVLIKDAIKNDEEDEISELFLRLQSGTTLKAQEKRNAMTYSKMRDFVKEIAQHPFFESCRFKNTRFTYDHVAAQLICLEIAGKPTSIDDRSLNEMYEKYKDADKSREIAKISKKITRVLNYLRKAFPNKNTQELQRFNVHILYLLSSILVKGYDYKGSESKLADWFLEFEIARDRNDELDEEKRDASLLEYKIRTQQSTDKEETIDSRLKYVEERFFADHPNLEAKDSTRFFTYEQRLAIYRRDKGICQIQKECDGEHLSWNEWHADHKKPHSKGGKTVVSNGQVACQACNVNKNNKITD